MLWFNEIPSLTESPQTPSLPTCCQNATVELQSCICFYFDIAFIVQFESLIWWSQGGMSNELYSTIARVTDGIYEGTCIFMIKIDCFGFFCNVIQLFVISTKANIADVLVLGIAIGGDVFPGSTLSDHILRLENIPQVMLVPFAFVTNLVMWLIFLCVLNGKQVLFALYKHT